MRGLRKADNRISPPITTLQEKDTQVDQVRAGHEAGTRGQAHILIVKRIRRRREKNKCSGKDIFVQSSITHTSYL